MKGRQKSNGHAAADRQQVDADGFVCLTGTLLWKYRAIDAEYRNAQLAALRKQVEIEEEVQKHDHLRGLIAERKALLGESSVRATELQAVQQEIETTLGVSLRNCAIDDKSGRIYLLGEDGTQKPVRAKPTGRGQLPRALKRAST
jgi:hypothetical protein